MAPLSPVDAVLVQNTVGNPIASTSFNPPSASAVSAFQAALAEPAMARTEAEWFGNSALESYPALAEGTPLLEIPGNISYLPGTTAVLEKVFPSLANQIPTPMDFLAAQLQLSSIQLSWQFTAKATGTMVQGVQSLVNSQV